MKAWWRQHPLLVTSVGVVVSFLIAAGILTWRTPAPQERFITITAQRFSYTPHVIAANRGDRISLRLLSKDVHHGLYLDGYELETNARPGQAGSLNFVAAKTGRFSFRCSMTCGPFHPYMIGYLKVNPDYRLWSSLWLVGGLLSVALVSLRRTPPPGSNNASRKAVPEAKP